MKIWFHGTNRQASQVISESGFAPSCWFARNLEDALEFGGEYVFEVALPYEPVIDGNWQMCVGPAVSTEAIVSLTKYEQSKLMDNPELRAKVFAANEATTIPLHHHHEGQS